MAAPKKQGRDGKPRGERATTVNLTLRLPPILLDRLRSAAEANQRSIASEAQRRLAQAEVTDIAKMVGQAIAVVEETSGREWSEDADVRMQCRAAADTMLDLVLGELVDEDEAFDKIVNDLGRQKWRDTGNILLTGKNLPTPEDIDGRINQLRKLWDARLLGAKVAVTGQTK